MLAAEASPQPGALDGAALRRVVVVLSTAQIVSWGCMYYAFAALQSSITADTGGSGVAVNGAFSLSQVVSAGAGLWVGLHIDAYAPPQGHVAGLGAGDGLAESYSASLE